MTRIVFQCLLAALFLSGCGKAPVDPAAIRNELESRSRQFEAAFNKKDVDGLMTDYWNSPDLVAMYPDSTYRGYDAVKGSWQRLFQMADVRKFALTEGHTVVDPDGEMAYQWGLYDFTFQPHGAPEIHAPGRFLLVWEKKGDRWVITLDHASPPLPPMPPPSPQAGESAGAK